MRSHPRATFSLDRRLHAARPLVLTWFERQYRVDMPQPSDVTTTGWELDHERRFGTGFFDERCELLDITLTRIASRGLRLAAVNATLRRAKRAQLNDAMAGATLDFRRQHATRVAQIQRHLDVAAAGIAEFQASATANDLPVTAAITATTMRRIKDALVEDPLLRHYGPGRYRRARPGRQSRPWVKIARHQLKRIGVRSDECENLLEAVGLTAYRSSSLNFSAEKN